MNEQAAEILAYKAVSSEQVKTLEPKAAKAANCRMYDLMLRAGEAAFSTLIKHWPSITRILVVAGNGNNAGDAYVVAKLAKLAGKQVSVICEDPKRKLLGDAGTAQAEWHNIQGSTFTFAQIVFTDYELIVDGLLGTGLTGEVRTLFQQVINQINQTSLQVLSIDLPSGMHANTGMPLPICVKADVTVTFIALKLGLITGKGKEFCGQVEFTDLAVGDEFYQLANVDAQVVNWSWLQPIENRPINGNKGTFGKLLCVGGNQGMPGAIRLSAEAALRTGAGLVKVYCHQSSGLHVASGRPEIMLQYQDLETALDWCTSIVIGPGLGQDQWAVQKLEQLLKYLAVTPKPVIIDADALNLLARKKVKLDVKKILASLPACILTPHPGEAARLLDSQISVVESDRYQACKAIAQMFACSCVLKGAGTLIYSKQESDEQHSFIVCNGGNPGMATAGMGDLLTGILGALLAQGMFEQQAAVYGVCAHAEAGDRVARQYGQRGMIASDLLQPLRAIINAL